MNSEAKHRSRSEGTLNGLIIVSSAPVAAITTMAMVTWGGGKWGGGVMRTLPPLRPLLGKGQAQAKVRASGSRHLVWHSELSIHGPARPPGIGVTRWVWHSTFALTSWPPVTAAAERLGLGQGTGSTGWWGMGEERWLREEEMEVWRRAAKREEWLQREGKLGFFFKGMARSKYRGKTKTCFLSALSVEYWICAKGFKIGAVVTAY